MPVRSRTQSGSPRGAAPPLPRALFSQKAGPSDVTCSPARPVTQPGFRPGRVAGSDVPSSTSLSTLCCQSLRDTAHGGGDLTLVRSAHHPKLVHILQVDTGQAALTRAVRVSLTNDRAVSWRSSTHLRGLSQDLAGHREPELTVSLKTTPEKLVVSL